MFGTALENLLGGASASSVTEIFIWVMMAVFVIAVFQGRKGRHDLFLEHAPAVLVSLGILGTFAGIVIGLLDFDAHNIQGSIEDLLDGLKTAFITSLVGMTLSIVLKGMDTWWFAPARNKADTPDAVTPEHIYGSMQRQVELLEALGQSMTGDEEGSVAGQLKLLRSDIGDFRSGMSRDRQQFEEKLFPKLDDFAQMLAKSATETVIEALRQVIVDFNKQLVEQFGDNFKALDASVKEMVTWQRTYKEHVESLEERIEVALSMVERTATSTEAINMSLQGAEKSMGSIDEQCQRIPVAVDELRAVLQTNQHQIQELERHLQAFVGMRDQATQAVPELQSHMERLSKELAESMQGVLARMHEGATEFGKSVDHTNAALSETSSVISTQSEKIAADLKDASEGFNSSARETLETLSKGSEALSNQMQEAVDKAARAMSDELGRAVGRIQEVMTSTVESTLRTMTTSVEGSLNETQQALQSSANRTLGAVEAQIKDATTQSNESLRVTLSAMDRAIERELNKVFSEMGSALATISRRIADDHAEYAEVARRS